MMSASGPTVTQLPMLTERTFLPANDQAGHPEYGSIGFWTRYGRGSRDARDVMEGEAAKAQAFRAYFCAKGPTACAQWGHWLDASGEDMILDPATFDGRGQLL